MAKFKPEISIYVKSRAPRCHRKEVTVQFNQGIIAGTMWGIGRETVEVYRDEAKLDDGTVIAAGGSHAKAVAAAWAWCLKSYDRRLQSYRYATLSI